MTVRPSSRPALETASSRGWPLVTRCMVRMMSPARPGRARSPHRHGRPRCQACTSSARPRRCKRCRRPISSGALALPGFSSLEAFDHHPAVFAGLALGVRSTLVHRSSVPPRAAKSAGSTRCAAPAIRSPAPDARCREAIGDVVARDDSEVFARVVAPSHDQLGCAGCPVFPVIDGQPIRPDAQVGPPCAPSGAGCRCARSSRFGPILGRDDEAEVVPVVGAAFMSVEVGDVGLRPVSSPARRRAHHRARRNADAWRATADWPAAGSPARS